MTRNRRWAAVLLGAVLGASAGCGADDPAPTQRVVVCWGTELPRPDTGVVRFSFQQHGVELVTASGGVDTLLAADVPTGAVTTVLANGEPFGEVGVDDPSADDGDAADENTTDADQQAPGYYGLTGPGCPDAAELGRLTPVAAQD
ncbi:hypothetical protein [Kineococcus rubinsiae]|uniref:hypothetical protein n=1 Tax=Kineococcus rubinsiae TaxID=2609562 RepID=UPI001430B2A5|nr:hypothetical protein [Kineococcus rubinsiae]NIZ91810.1 hypothetical protein [Kineococcus rubinsiae]